MKQLLTSLILALSLIAAPAASAQSARDILGGLLGGGASSSSSSSDSTKQSGGLSDLLGGVAGALGLGSTELSVKNLEGTWKYSAPAVSFKSDNLLLKAGGTAAAATIEKKLEPYYKTAGLTNLVFTVKADSTFTMKARLITINGTIDIAADGKSMHLNFKALGKINIGSMEAYTKLSDKDKLEMTFDVSKLVTILEKVGSLTGNSTIKGVTTLLEQYDGVTAGFQLKKSSE